jgi:dTDP-4-dehydrorhamnose 3,5-epimerase
VQFIETELAGVYLLELEMRSDERGFFARTWCAREFADRGLGSRIVQCNISHNSRRGTLRGLHYQADPHAEAKLVRCTHGAIYDVILDLRPESRTFKHWLAVELSDSNRRMLYIPEGFAHGFQTIADGSEVFYQMSEFYHPEAAKGIRWNDPTFGIPWPIPNPILSARDHTWPDFQ